MTDVYIVKPSSRKDKKLMVIMGPNMVHHFGQSGYDDFTTHNDQKRKDNHISRMNVNQDWSKKGINTSGLWANHILWENLPSQGQLKTFNKNLVSRSFIK